MMAIVLLLLTSGVVQLFSLSSCAPHPPNSNKLHPNLKDIITDIEKYNDSINKEYFVEDVQDLADAGCKDEFFCKVSQILKNHKHFSRGDQQELKIVNNLDAFINKENFTCEENSNAEGNSVKKPITELLRFLKECSQHRNTHGRPKAQS